MIKALREIDDLYFGCTRRGNKPSALSAALAIATGFMPWVFVTDYLAGRHDESLQRIAARKRGELVD